MGANRKRLRRQERRYSALGLNKRCNKGCDCSCHQRPFHIHPHFGLPCSGKGR